MEEDGIVLSSAQEPSNVQVLEISAEEEAQQNERPKVPHAHDSLFIPEEKASEATAEKEAHYELGLTRGVKPVLVQVWEECCKLLPAEHRDRLQYQIKDVFNTCAKLSFLKVQHQLVSFLENRSKAPHPKAQAVPNTWETNDPHLIFNTLQTLEMHSLEVNIHRVYGQIRFFTVVNETATGRQRSKPAKLIRDLLLQRTENQVSQGDLDKKVSVYKKEYDGGRRWLEVSYWFGGMGVILVFMVAGTFSSRREYRFLLHTVSRDFNLSHFDRMDGGPTALFGVQCEVPWQHKEACRVPWTVRTQGFLRTWVSESGAHG